MISVQIQINGQTIFCRTAVNKGMFDSTYHEYEVDDRRRLVHKRDHGAIPLAIAMLADVHEQGPYQVSCEDNLKRAVDVIMSTVLLPVESCDPREALTKLKPVKLKPEPKHVTMTREEFQAVYPDRDPTKYEGVFFPIGERMVIERMVNVKKPRKKKTK